MTTNLYWLNVQMPSWICSKLWWPPVKTVLLTNITTRNETHRCTGVRISWYLFNQNVPFWGFFFSHCHLIAELLRMTHEFYTRSTDFDSGERETQSESEGGECGRQVGGGWGRFDVRNISLKPVSFVMCFKRFHAWAEFLTSYTPPATLC